MDLHPMSYDEICQIELLHAAAAAASSANHKATSAAPSAAQAATMLPIMVIPTSMMPPGTIFTTSTAVGGEDGAPHNATLSIDGGGGGGGGLCEHQFYQLQPTHILAATMPTTAAKQQLGDLALSPGDGGAGDAAAISLVGGVSPPPRKEQLPHMHGQQLPQTILGGAAMCAVPCSASDAMVNILCGGGGGKGGSALASLLAQKSLDSATLPRGLPSGAYVQSGLAAQHDESDFEGSECGASISTTNCIPPFRFSGCGMMLQPTQPSSLHQQHQQRQESEPPSVIGCGALSHMMGSFAAAAGARHGAGRLAVGAALTGTLGRHRRSAAAAAQTPKRVSFRADTLPPPDDLHQQLFDVEPSELRLVHQATAPSAALSACSYMHCESPMDYQTTGFGGLPDVTEHSNIRRTLSRQSSLCHSDPGGEILGMQKSKESFGERIKLTSSSPGADSQHDGRFKHHKSKAAQQAGRRTIVKSYKTKRGSFAIGLTLVAALSLAAIAALLSYQYLFMAPSRNSLTQRLKIVTRILRDVPLVDGHNNFAWNVRKYGHSSLELVHVQQSLNQKNIWTRPAWAQTDMERLKQGLVGVQVWSAYVPCKAQGLDAVQLALEQIDIIRRFADMFADKTTLITSSQEILAARRRGLMASVIGIEGGHAIGASMGVLRSLYSLGARYLTLTHRCDVPWASSSSTAAATSSSLASIATTAPTATNAAQEHHGLTPFGKAIVREMNRLGMMIDLSHSSDATARDVLQVTRAPVIFSHSAARNLCNSTRNVPDDILRLVAENGGLVMVSFDSEDVACGGGRQAQLQDVADHINYIRSIAGIQHIGLGAGYDGIKVPPTGLEDVSKYPNLLAALLEDPNWSEEDIAMLAGKNFLRIMETVENVRDYWKRAAIQPTELTESQPKSQCTYMSS